MRRRLCTLILLLLAAMWVLLPVNAQDKPGGKVKAFVSILPIAYLVERVGGPNVEVSVLVGPGQDPHSFEPTPKLVAKLAESKALFKMGFPFEETLIKKMRSTFKNVEVIDLQQGIKLRTMTEDEERSHGDGEEHEHGHGAAEEHEHHHEAGDLDQHSWLDPQIAKIQAKTIADTLIRIDPSHKDQYEKNLKGFQADLDAIHEQLTKVLASVKGKSFFVFHPAYGYFGDAYGLKQVPVELEGKEPTARQLARLIERAKKDGVKVIFVEPQFSKKSAEALAKSIGGAVVPLDPLAKDYLKNLREMAAKLEATLSSQKK
jgi:zinc transport system substrate-binding protein